MSKDYFFAAGFAVVLACMAVPAAAQTQAQPQENCLRALNGACTKPALVEAARVRALIISTARVSYRGSPMGTVGGSQIPYERFFQDDPVVFGLPTFTYTCCNVFVRSK